MVPDVVFEMEGLELLSVARNKLTALPPGLPCLPVLRTLNVSQNAISPFPRILRACRLTNLDASGNAQFCAGMELAPDDPLAHTLQFVSLENCGLEALPAALKSLAGLRWLGLKGNALAALDFDALAAFHDLTRLDVSHNALEGALPDGVVRLAKLETLDVSNNRLTELPRSLAAMAALKVLRAAGNRLHAVPRELGDMAGLQVLDVSGNSIVRLPCELCNLEGTLKELHLAGNPLEPALDEVVARKSVQGVLAYLKKIEEDAYLATTAQAALRRSPSYTQFFGKRATPGRPKSRHPGLMGLFADVPPHAAGGASSASGSSAPLSGDDDLLFDAGGSSGSGSCGSPCHSGLSASFATPLRVRQPHQPGDGTTPATATAATRLRVASQHSPAPPGRGVFQPSSAGGSPLTPWVAPPPSLAAAASSVPHSLSMPHARHLGQGSPGTGDSHQNQQNQQPPSLREVLADPLGYQSFREFLSEELSEENLTFWSDVEQYRQLASERPGEMAQEARRLYERYLGAAAAKFELNVPGPVKSRLKRAVIDGSEAVTPALFDAAQKNVFELMATDSYPRFLKSSYFSIYEGIIHARRR